MSPARPWVGAAVLCMLALTRQVDAQERNEWTVAFGASGTRQIARSRVGTARARLGGPLFGGEALVTWRHFAVRVRYGQGRVTSDTAARDVVEGEGLLGYEIRPWLHAWFGLHARTFVVPDLSDRRWHFWAGRVTARGAVFPGRVEGFVELWHGAAGRLSRPATPASGRGGEAGLEVRLGAPWWGRLAYGIEQGRAGSGPRQTVEKFTVTIGYVPVR